MKFRKSNRISTYRTKLNGVILDYNLQGIPPPGPCFHSPSRSCLGEAVSHSVCSLDPEAAGSNGCSDLSHCSHQTRIATSTALVHQGVQTTHPQSELQTQSPSLGSEFTQGSPYRRGSHFPSPHKKVATPFPSS